MLNLNRLRKHAVLLAGRLQRLPAPDTITRIAIGLSSLVVLCLVTIDALFGLVEDPLARELQRRRAVSQTLADQLMVAATRLGAAEVGQMLDAFRRREPAALAIRLRPSDAAPVASSGVLQPAGGEVLALEVPVQLQGRAWGGLELQWQPLSGEAGLARWMTMTAAWPLFTFLGVALLLRLYLGRVLHQLDPSGVVPARVRSAYNTLTEGVMMLDRSGRILLVNEAMAQIAGRRDVSVGRLIDELDWVGMPDAPQDMRPWRVTLETGSGVERIRMVIGRKERSRVVLVTCAPLDADLSGKQARARRRPPLGCLVVMVDQTSLERAHERLSRALTELQGAHEQIRQKNEELFRLATRDPMTGCLNRRAFFEQAGVLKETANLEGRPVAVVMCDIDHFKSFNDRYGHAVGDEVIKAVAGIYNSSAREADRVCRYGGEEFCILLPDCEEAVALAVADTLRRQVQDAAGASIDHDPRLTITSSFGVAVTRSTRTSLETLIDQADQALYQSKRNGRNRCTLHEAEATEPVA